jgi:Ca2+-binding RTX toxin-like protein
VNFAPDYPPDGFVNTIPTITSDGGGDTTNLSIAENTTAVTTVIAVDSDAGQSLSYSIVGGADAALFGIDATTGALTLNTGPNFEAPADAGGDNIYDLTVQVSDGNGGSDTQALSISVTNVNAAPTLALSNAVSSLSEATNATNRVKVADITVTDDGEGSNELTVSGDDAALFEIDGTELFLKAGTVLDYEAGNTVLDVTVAVDDPDVGGSPDGSAALSINVTNIIGETWVGSKFRGAQTHSGTDEEDKLSGGSYNDTLDGAGGNDTINAGGGNDIVIGGTGNDTMNGGAGKDVFIFGAGFGNDRILQFDANPAGGQDRLDISAFGITGGNFSTRVTIADVGVDTLITIEGNAAQTILLVGIGDAATVTQADFVLV